MTVDKKLKRLKTLLERLEAGEDVAARDLKSAITKAEFDEYQAMWSWHKDGMAFISGSTHYDEWLRKGIFHYNKAKSGRFNAEASKRFHRKAQACFETALEQLQSDVNADPGIAAAYDRHLDFSPGSDSFSLDPSGMPRRITSKSFDNLSDIYGGQQAKVTKRDLKIKIVKKSLAHFDQRNRECNKDRDAEDIRKPLERLKLMNGKWIFR